MNYDHGRNWGGVGVGPGGGLPWGGVAASTGSTRAGSVVSSYQQRDEQHQQHLSNTSKVGLYTRYYHEWKAIADSPASTASQKEWATYYADLASRAAHFYHQNPNTIQPPPQDLPPAPPGSSASDADVVAQAHQQPQESALCRPQDKHSSLDAKSFQVYVDKCLQQCRTQQEKDEIISATKTVLQKAIREGHLHNKDWSREPLVVLPVCIDKPGLLSSANQSVQKTASRVLHNNSDNTTNKKLKKKHSSSKKTEKGLVGKKRSYLESSAPASNSYYGPSVSSCSIFTTGSAKSAKLTKEKQGFNLSSTMLSQRAKRFASSIQENSFDSYEESNQGAVVVGTCRMLEKEYLRLTSAPKPELVRPQPILERHFSNLKSEYGDVKRRREYLWFCSQLKAIRQDCTVQHLKNEFCVWVYEFHAKVALENGDMNEFNQCQTQLKYLYPVLEGAALKNRSEFLAYRILYAVYLNLHSDKVTIDMKDILGRGENTSEPSVRQALDVLAAAQEGDYHMFFSRLYPSKYGYQNYLLEKMVPIFRRRALETMCCAYRPTLEVDFVCDALQISEKEWLGKVGCVFEILSGEGAGCSFEVIKTKESHIREPEDTQKTSKLM
ncbi:hypothetical protein ACA910_007912 [Epithemia clementina (nom. ined.)]